MVTCKIRGGHLDTVLAVHKKPDRFEVSLGISEDNYSRSWVACASCGSVTNSMHPANVARLEQLAEGYYEVDFANSSVGDKFAKVMALGEERSDNAGRVNRVIEYLDNWRRGFGRSGGVAKVLDIGAGTGLFIAKLLQSRSQTVTEWRATAIEPDPIAAEHLRGLNTFEVIQGTFEVSQLVQAYDLITLNKVIEHLPRPQALLKGVSNALDTNGGIIYVEVPDVLTIGRHPSTDNILGSLHHHLYSPKGLTSLIESVGLRLLSLGRIVEPSGKITLFCFGCNNDTFNGYASSK